MRTRIAVLVVLLLGVCIWGGAGELAADSLGAPDNHSVLILDGTSSGTNNWEAESAVSNGLTAVVVNPSQWLTMTAEEFTSYRALVMGDGICWDNSTAVSALESNRTVWGAAVQGNLIIIGSDPDNHADVEDGARILILNGIAFAAAQTNSTGAYVALGHHYSSAVSNTPVVALEPFGDFRTEGLGGLDDVHIAASHPALSGLTDANLSDWGNSVHEGFDSFPSNILVLAIAKDGPPLFTTPDQTTGAPYILVKGEGVVATGSCSLEAVIAQIQALNLRQSQKTALINAVTAIHRLLVAIKCHTALHLEKAFAKRMQKAFRLGQVDINTIEDLRNCINQFIGNCTPD